MLRFTRILFFFALTLAASRTSAQTSIPVPAAPPSAPIGSGPRRIYTAVRLAAAPPRIDGRLDDSCWDKDGTWAGDYTQFSPKHGSTPTEPSKLKVLYDDKYLYVAIRAYDDPAKMTRFAGPRDKFTGDIVGITFDTYFDHRHGFEFDLTSAGQKIDLVLSNDDWDTTWNPVWDGKVAHDEQGWTAEMRIPLSQIRYNNVTPQIWGMHSWRWLARNSEESQWKLLANDGTGLVYSFGELHGLDLPRPRRHMELVPYVSAKYTRHDNDANGRGQKTDLFGGADAKLQLTTSFTLDATINPDFGQVESDPSEMNLTAFETFLPERRPFFIEGKNIFDFAFDEDDLLFYSRRIGHGPSLAPRSDAYDVPESTSILGAWKVSGKSSGGLSVGLVHAVTSEEHASYADATGVHAQSLEPATQFAVLRVQQDFDRGQTVFGGIATVTQRTPKSAELADLLPKQAYAGGLDFERFWADRTYSFAAKAIGSHVTGAPAAVARLQLASARYYQRPDADYVTFDPTRRSLDGWGAYVMAGKRSKGNWRYHEKLSAYSPGLEFNDLGYLREADRIRQHTEVAYVEKQPAHFYRDYELRVENNNYWNFGGEHLGSDLSAYFLTNLQNKAYAEAKLKYSGEALDPVALRGGPALRVPGNWYLGAYANTDAERRWVASLSVHQTIAEHDAYSDWHVMPQLTYRPTSALVLSIAANRNGTKDHRYFVPSTSSSGTPTWIVSSLKSESLTLTGRVQWFITPGFSVQYYGSPFGSSGAYSNFQRVADPRAARYPDRTLALPRPTLFDGTYYFDAPSGGRADYSVGRPDFSFGQFRSNLVVRWEFRPGSDLYVVWSQERSDFRADPSNSATIIRRLPSAPQTNVLLIKCSYWFSM